MLSLLVRMRVKESGRRPALLALQVDLQLVVTAPVAVLVGHAGDGVVNFFGAAIIFRHASAYRGLVHDVTAWSGKRRVNVSPGLSSAMRLAMN